jgi:hypothetical protein
MAQRLGRGLLRLGIGAGALVLAVLVFAVAAGLVMVGGILLVSGRDMSLGPGWIPFWPEWLVPRDLLHGYAWAYIAAGVVLVMIVLPLSLALLEKFVVMLRKRNRPGLTNSHF